MKHVPTCDTIHPQVWPPTWAADDHKPAEVDHVRLRSPQFEHQPHDPDDGCELIKPGTPCPVCDSLEIVVNALGVTRCQRCEPFRNHSTTWARKAARLRRLANGGRQ